MQTQFNPTIITISSGDDRHLTLSMPWGSTLEDWKTAFKAILIFETFCEDQTREIFGEFDEESDFQPATD